LALTKTAFGTMMPSVMADFPSAEWVNKAEDIPQFLKSAPPTAP
jgi:hypothetical protein